MEQGPFEATKRPRLQESDSAQSMGNDNANGPSSSATYYAELKASDRMANSNQMTGQDGPNDQEAEEAKKDSVMRTVSQVPLHGKKNPRLYSS
jgi:hypothetical protein